MEESDDGGGGSAAESEYDSESSEPEPTHAAGKRPHWLPPAADAAETPGQNLFGNHQGC